jgi:MFS family permease
VNRRRHEVALIATGQLVTTAGLTVVVPLLPLHLEALGVAGPSRNLWAGAVLAAPALTLAAAAPMWGRAADRWGPKAMVVRSLCGLGVALALMALARSPLQLLGARLLQGAAGGISDAGATYVVSAADAGVASGLGRLQRASAAGALVGPLAGGPLADTLGLGAVLAFVAALTAATALLAGLILEGRRPERVGAAKGADEEPVEVAPGGASASRRRCLVAGLLAQVGSYGLVTVFAPHVRAVIPDPRLAGTWVGGLQAVTWAAALASSTWWSGRLERHLPFATAAALGALGLAIVLQALPPQPAALVPLRVLQGWCASAIVPAVLLEASRAAGKVRSGAAIGAATGVLTAGQVVGALGAGVAATVLPVPVVIVILGTVVAGGGVVALGGARREQAAVVAR